MILRPPSKRGPASVAAAAVGALVLAACTVGPDYHRPDIAVAPTYSGLATKPQAPLSTTTAAPPDEATITRWWSQFDDPLLDRLVAQALRDNLDVQTAYARIRQAREQVVVAGAPGLPHLGANGTVARVNSNARSGIADELSGGRSMAGASAAGGSGAAGETGGGFQLPTSLDVFSPSFDATWEVDVFGGVRRSVEADRATTQAMIWAKRDAQVSLTSEVATDYLTLRSLQAQIAIAQGEVASQRGIFTIVRQQSQTGFVNRLNVNQQEAQVQATIAAIPELQANARAQIHAIGVLLGQSPEALEPELTARAGDRPLPVAPKVLPVGLPSDLLRRRPDVREAERQLAAATAQVGVQTANLYPKFNLIALGALASGQVSDLFNGDNATSVGVALIQWPVFEGGEIRANIRSARAQQDQAYLAYKKSVLTAVQNTEDALDRYAADQRRIVAQQASVNASTNSLAIARQQYAVGLVTFINVLNAEQTELNARNMLVQAQGQQATDLASLYKALGGGWTADEGKLLTQPGVSWR